ncbi:DUF3175 domain-containing protein [Sphingomonas prati]|uniref:DUF3175 domain-containing protein n=1 Tax=Sphingomonas prati TaxID=1843237 RepID=A0A7W9F2B1_9SPHN|nr:DUF3175 domain-containing protein [Sphingomonas prati]MBB5730203.1 hypothetical protein [Sphingomonas prati]GGE92335.1 hypothetical protein GCM10011404_26560 [Sphingomonas prati]
MVLRHWSRSAALPGPAPSEDLFLGPDPKRIASAVKAFAETRGGLRTSPFRSAMSMLTFHINRAGDALSPERRRILEAAKDELRKAFGRK